jgi:hypothetical protein
VTASGADGRLLYSDANSIPWPLNHYAYVRACVERLRKEIRFEPSVRFPPSQLHLQDSRRALVRLEPTEDGPGLLLSWDERHGWYRVEGPSRRALVLGAEPLLSPEPFTLAATALLRAGTRQLIMVADRDRGSAHPVDGAFERRLASYRRP